MAYFGHVFGRSCWGGFAPPDPPALDMVFVVLGEVFSQLCQENPRTCRGQSRESKNLPRTKPRRKSVRTPSGKLKSPSFLLPNSLPYRNPPYSKNLGRRYSPQGGFNPPPNGVGVLDSAHGFCQSFLPSSFWILLLGGSCLPLLNPPPVASGRLLPLRRSAALAPLGASWAEKIAFQEAFKN